MNIRATNPYGFRSGEWAEVLGIEFDLAHKRPVFRVRFIDGATDTWVVYDPADPYEFRAFGGGERRSNKSLAEAFR